MLRADRPVFTPRSVKQDAMDRAHQSPPLRPGEYRSLPSTKSRSPSMEETPVVLGQSKGVRQGRPKPLPQALPKLREIPPAPAYFWKQPLHEYLNQEARDKTYDGTNSRKLPPNEIDALALNEVAAAKGQGFFLFLPSRNSWSHQTYEPKSRGPTLDNLR